MVSRIGLTFDTGALIALERRTQRIWNIYRTAMHDAIPITVPVAVVIEWWRGRPTFVSESWAVSASSRFISRWPEPPVKLSPR